MPASESGCVLGYRREVRDMDLFSQIENNEREEILALRKELVEANHKYYVENAPTLSDYEFDQKLRRLQDLEALHPDMFDPKSPTQHVGSDLNAPESVSLEDGAKSAYSLEVKGKEYTFPTNCPECGAKLVRVEGEAAWRCPNEANCPPQIKGKIEHFVSRKAMNIDGLGSETIDLLYSQGLLHNIADIYDLKHEDIARQERLGDKSALNILTSIEESKKIPWARVLFALGIRMVGETTAKKIAKRFPSIEQLQWASAEQLMSIEDVGEQIANNIIAYFNDLHNLGIVQRLLSAGVQFETTEEQMTELSNRLEGKTIVISGVFAKHSRDEYKAMIEAHGGKNAGSISKKTSFVLAGENMGPEKKKKAEGLGITLMNEEEFLKLIEA